MVFMVRDYRDVEDMSEASLTFGLERDTLLHIILAS